MLYSLVAALLVVALGVFSWLYRQSRPADPDQLLSQARGKLEDAFSDLKRIEKLMGAGAQGVLTLQESRQARTLLEELRRGLDNLTSKGGTLSHPELRRSLRLLARRIHDLAARLRWLRCQAQGSLR